MMLSVTFGPRLFTWNRSHRYQYKKTEAKKKHIQTNSPKPRCLHVFRRAQTETRLPPSFFYKWIKVSNELCIKLIQTNNRLYSRPLFRKVNHVIAAIFMYLNKIILINPFFGAPTWLPCPWLQNGTKKY